ncbi:hypothetical protein BH24PSE2_BH24PSE2_19010 [soil metagenome]
MYQSFYGLNEMPFTLQPDPAFLFFSKKHKLALTLLRYAVDNKTLCSVMTGDIGSGKTTVVRQLLSEMDDSVTAGLIFNTHRGMADILKWICMAFGLAYENKDELQLHEAFLDFLLEKFVAGGHAVLIVDEAQNLAPAALEELRLVTNFNTEKDILLQLILIGQPELRDTLRTPGFEQFSQRISVQYHLEPLERDETLQYIHHRLRVAGGDGRTFDDDACHKIWYYSRGVPRVINTLCDAALLYGFAEERKFVDRFLVDEVIEDRRRVGIMDLPDARDEPEPERRSAAARPAPPSAEHEESRDEDADTAVHRPLGETQPLQALDESEDSAGDTMSDHDDEAEPPAQRSSTRNSKTGEPSA